MTTIAMSYHTRRRRTLATNVTNASGSASGSVALGNVSGSVLMRLRLGGCRRRRLIAACPLAIATNPSFDEQNRERSSPQPAAIAILDVLERVDRRLRGRTRPRRERAIR